MVGQCRKKLSGNNFEWMKDTPQFKILEKILKSNEGYFLEVDFNIFKNYMNFIMTYHFYQKE